MRHHYIVHQSFVGLLYEDGAFVRQLEAGRHRLRRPFLGRRRRTIVAVDMRQRSLTIKGQEILTKDKVAIRVSLLVYFRVKDPAAAVHNVASYEERIYEDVQLGARRFLASRDLEAILSDRNEISDSVSEDVQEAAETYGVEILRADVKDLVFPGNLREIMNKVLETERKAEAKLIEARKEAEALQIAATARHEATSQELAAERRRIETMAEAERAKNELRLQTEVEQAKAMQDNPALFKLKQLETLRSMAQEGGRFVIGLSDDGIASLLDEPG